MLTNMARVTFLSYCEAKQEKEKIMLPNGRPKIGTLAKTKRKRNENLAWGYPDVRRACGEGGDASLGNVAR